MICHGWMIKHTAPSQRFDNATLYAIDAETEGSFCSLWPQISNALSMRRKAGKKRITQALQIPGKKPLFIKTSAIDSIPSRIRTTLGLRRRSGLYDWPLEELSNHLEAQKRTDRVPRLLGYGLIQRRCGMVSEVFLGYEHLTDWMDGYQWLRINPSRACDFVEAGLALIAQLSREGIYHLDLWAGNIMLRDNDIQTLKAIDLENCFIGENSNISETLGFQFALLYQHQLQDFIEEREYDRLVDAQVRKMPEVQRSGFCVFYEHFKRCGAHRKERHLIPKLGAIATFQRGLRSY